MTQDVRDKSVLSHEDILRLNFIRVPGVYFYRRHYRAGLRSHIMEVIKPEDLIKERNGVSHGGLKWFPRSKPFRMLRIFRSHFYSFKEAEAEMERVKIMVHYLGKGMMAMSQEFIVDYRENALMDFLLCGLQEYVEGEVLDPWGHLGEENLLISLRRMLSDTLENLKLDTGMWMNTLRKNFGRFCNAVKRMVSETGFIPDLAGVGNLLISERGDVKLVDINNISRVNFNSEVDLDDKGYPVCDKSIQALWMLEKKLLGRDVMGSDHIYKVFLDPGRMRDVEIFEKEFHRLTAYGSSYPVNV
jgi:hypothetical protein